MTQEQTGIRVESYLNIKVKRSWWGSEIAICDQFSKQLFESFRLLNEFINDDDINLEENEITEKAQTPLMEEPTMLAKRKNSKPTPKNTKNMESSEILSLSKEQLEKYLQLKKELKENGIEDIDDKFVLMCLKAKQ